MRGPGRDLGRSPSGALVPVGGGRSPGPEPGRGVSVRRAQSGPHAGTSGRSLGQNLRAGPLARARSRARVRISSRNLMLGLASLDEKVARFPDFHILKTRALPSYGSNIALIWYFAKTHLANAFTRPCMWWKSGIIVAKTAERPDAHGCGALRLREEGPSVKPRNRNGTKTTSPSWS